MKTLPELVLLLWGWPQSAKVVDEYKDAFNKNKLMARDLAAFCNAAAPITGASEFERGVEEGKRRVWLHASRMCGLQHTDFIRIADGADKT